MNQAQMNHEALASLRKNHPAWRLLRADSAPLLKGATLPHVLFVH
ncbi:MAG: hypothetical protein Q9M11_07970 [Mariprofundaceae bacterium]|nr:hypothetical protein [Mariprofundaceae bacterium]